MITLTLNNYPLYILDAGVVPDGYPPEPFFYELSITKHPEHLVFKAACESIPCPTCPISASCKSGANLTPALSAYTKEHFPEIFI